MARPTSRSALLDAAAVEFETLQDAVASVDVDRRETPGVCVDWSVKDLLAHLDAWHDMFSSWEANGAAGTKPEMPAPGYTWSGTPALNQTIFEATAQDDWDDVVDRLVQSHAKAVATISAYTDDQLFTKKLYPWTGSTSVGSYAISATSSHYSWARKLIRKWAKTNRVL